jgi:hypothetical protein
MDSNPPHVDYDSAALTSLATKLPAGQWLQVEDLERNHFSRIGVLRAPTPSRRKTP